MCLQTSDPLTAQSRNDSHARDRRKGTSHSFHSAFPCITTALTPRIPHVNASKELSLYLTDPIHTYTSGQHGCTSPTPAPWPPEAYESHSSHTDTYQLGKVAHYAFDAVLGLSKHSTLHLVLG